MTTEVEVQVGPMVQVVVDGEAHPPFAFSEIAREGQDPATVSDAEMIELVALHLEGRPASDFNRHQVTRPETGNILISPKAVFGAHG